MLTRKNYVAIARIIRGKTLITYADAVKKSALIESLADYFEADNPRFNRSKFINACMW